MRPTSWRWSFLSLVPLALLAACAGEASRSVEETDVPCPAQAAATDDWRAAWYTQLTNGLPA